MDDETFITEVSAVITYLWKEEHSELPPKVRDKLKYAAWLVEKYQNNTTTADDETMTIPEDFSSIHQTAVSQNGQTRSTHVGSSDYSDKSIQPWDIWIEYGLNPWDADIVKRVLRTKEEPTMSDERARILDYQKIRHIAQERIDQINNGDPYYKQND